MEIEPGGIGEPTNLRYQLASMSGIVSAQAISRSAGSDVSAGGGQGTGITDLKGMVLTNVQVQLIFWGASWGSNASPLSDDVTKAVQNIFSGPYMSKLSQYRGIKDGTLLGTTVVTSSNPPDPFSNDNVADLVTSLIATGKVPKPEDGKQILYCVIMPVGVNYNQSNVNGEHSFAINVSYSFPVDVDIDKVFYAWVMNDGTLEDITIIFSHELVEACSDPDGNGIQVLPLTPNAWHEIGDVCEGISNMVNGVWVQAYWSQSDGACVTPEM